MSDEDLMEEFGDLMVTLMVTLAPILLRAHEANLVSPTEQAEIATLQATLFNLFTKTGGTAEEMEQQTAELRDRIFGGAS